MNEVIQRSNYTFSYNVQHASLFCIKFKVKIWNLLQIRNAYSYFSAPLCRLFFHFPSTP